MANTWLVKVERVKESIDALLSHEAHQWYPGYMSLRRQARLQSDDNGLDYAEIEPNWRDLGQFLSVPGGPTGRPFLRPFWSGTRERNQEWLNQNLAGSYAPSSWRNVQLALAHEGSDRQIGLKDGHAKIALETLLSGTPLPALPAAAFFLRNHSFRDPFGSDVDVMIRAFAYEFGYREGDEEEFLTLYDIEWTSPHEGAWLVMSQDIEDSGDDVSD